MYMLLFVVIILIIYIVSFRNDFKQEDLQKVAPVLAFFCLAMVLLTILGSIHK